MYAGQVAEPVVLVAGKKLIAAGKTGSLRFVPRLGAPLLVLIYALDRGCSATVAMHFNLRWKSCYKGADALARFTCRYLASYRIKRKIGLIPVQDALPNL